MSLRLASEHKQLNECPVGAVLREAPYVYEAIAAQSYAEAGAFNPMEQSQWLQHAMAVTASEKARMNNTKDEMRRATDQAKNDARYAASL